MVLPHDQPVHQIIQSQKHQDRNRKNKTCQENRVRQEIQHGEVAVLEVEVMGILILSVEVDARKSQ